MAMVALAMLSLSTLELRNVQYEQHQVQARANARMALMQAIGELQRYAGPDQRVTARADILENGAGIANKNWFGVWSTTVESSGRHWPVIGKATASGSPYSRSGAYEDLRHVQANLSGGAWRSELHQGWLVSQRDAHVDVSQPLSESDDAVIEIIGRGTLGSGLSDADFERERVLVQKVDVGKTGAYAWYIADNSQKASIDPFGEIEHVEAALEASPRGNPQLLKLADGSDGYVGFTDAALEHEGKLISYETLALTQSNMDKARQALQEKYHHLTAYAPGLFVDTMLGGLRKDLTPLLLADKSEPTINFSDAVGSVTRNFSSDYPIIPGPDHGVLGPSFGALRDWALHAYTTGNDAETAAPSSAIRMRPTTHWPHAISDGAALDAREWAESAPKIHPVMTDVRWHYYFSHHNNRIRAHIIPRVCLWNPYNKELEIPDMTVMMPNPFYKPWSGNVDFFPEEEYVKELKTDHPSIFGSWDDSQVHLDENGVAVRLHKLHAEPFPKTRYLAFTLKAGRLVAGECQVFSPEVGSTGVSVNGARLQKYDENNPSNNILSSSAEQGRNHFYFDHGSDAIYKIRQSSNWKTLTSSQINLIDLSRIFNYQPSVIMQTTGEIDTLPFILKGASSASLTSLYSNSAYPTLQLVYGGSGGASSGTYYSLEGQYFGHAAQESPGSGYLQRFEDSGSRYVIPTHQIGAKLLWLDESATEGNGSPLRVGRWTNDHMVYRVCPVANWNIRAQLTARSPASQCGAKWYMTGMGSWLLQFSPLSPQDANDQPSLNADSTAFVKNPFGAATNLEFAPRVVLFDLPEPDFGVISLSKLRHAMISPYSWNPSYIIGHSLRDLHSPAESTAHDVAINDYSGSAAATRWDYLNGGMRGSLSHGPYARTIDSQGLLQIGSQGVSRSVAGSSLSSSNEILAYDIAFEVNQNLWDRYFISGMPMSSDTQSFDWDPKTDKPLWNSRYQFNFDASKSLDDAVADLSSGDASNTAFWENASILKNRAAFNVNSTSVDAWVAFLSGTLGIKRPTESGELDGSQVSFARHRNPFASSDTADADPDQEGGWTGARELTDGEIRTLATNIVEEVKKRGPFVSIADFVNRRLTDEQDDLSSMGTLDAAIKTSDLNAEFENNPEYQSTAVNVGSRTDAPDNNLSTFKESYRFQKDGSYTTVQPVSQAWGMPGYLTQGDILDSIAPAITVRGDTYTIRAYGESSEQGQVKARAWIEATVERTPNYLDSSSGGNVATDSAIVIDYGTGAYSEGSLTETNQRFGRKFVIKSMRWLGLDEI